MTTLSVKRSSMFDASSKVNFMYSTFMRKWVKVLFQENSKYDKTLYMKKGRFFTHRSIYIWNVLLLSFPTIGCMIGKGDYNKSYIFLFFGKKTVLNGNISGTKNGKNSKNNFFECTLNKECIGLFRKT